MENAARFVQITSCTCLGYVVTYECTVRRELGTVWSRSVFNCPSSGDEIYLLGSYFNSVICNNGMITGKVVRRDDSGFYTSQVSIIVSSELIGRNVSCAQDDGDLELIGSATIILTTKGMCTIQYTFNCIPPIHLLSSYINICSSICTATSPLLDFY